MTHQSQVPHVAASYFASISVTEHPLIAETYMPGRGWQRYAGRKRVSHAEARKLRQSGVTMIALDAGGHRADFNVRELGQLSGFGQWRTRPDLSSPNPASGLSARELFSPRGEWWHAGISSDS